MPRSATVKLKEPGIIKFPQKLLRKFPVGSEFAITCNNGTIVMEQITKPDPLGRDPKALARFDAARKRIQDQLRHKRLTMKHILATRAAVRKQQRAQGNAG